MKKTDKLLGSILTIALGILFIILKGEVVSWAMTICGVSLVMTAISKFINKQSQQGIICLVIGILIICFGWTLITAAIYILAAILLISGIMQLCNIYKVKGMFWEFVGPVMSVIVALCLLFNQGSMISWIFIVAGICLIIQGLVEMLSYLKNKTN